MSGLGDASTRIDARHGKDSDVLRMTWSRIQVGTDAVSEDQLHKRPGTERSEVAVDIGGGTNTVDCPRGLLLRSDAA